jgi:hypothetical protein
MSDYVENNRVYHDDQFPMDEGVLGVKCRNWELCGTALPEVWINDYLCINCHMLFGTWGDEKTGKGVLPILESVECSICLEVKRSVELPNCDHSLCIDCFKRCCYGEPSDPEPQFPYSEEVEERYREERTEAGPTAEDEWDDYANYPLVLEYRKKEIIWERLEDEREYKTHYAEEHLKKCPLCRANITK